MTGAKQIYFLAVKLLLLQFGRFYLDMEHVKTFVRTALLIVPHFVLYDVCGPFYLSNEAATILIIHHTKTTFFTFQNGNDSDTAYKHLA